jgi:hypothetical protein
MKKKTNISQGTCLQGFHEVELLTYEEREYFIDLRSRVGHVVLKSASQQVFLCRAAMQT